MCYLCSLCVAYENWWQPPEEVIVIMPREEKKSSSAPAHNIEVMANNSGYFAPEPCRLNLLIYCSQFEIWLFVILCCHLEHLWSTVAYNHLLLLIISYL